MTRTSRRGRPAQCSWLPAMLLLGLFTVLSIPNTGCGEAQPPPPAQPATGLTPPTTSTTNTAVTSPTGNTTSTSSTPQTTSSTSQDSTRLLLAALEAKLNLLTAQADSLLTKLKGNDLVDLQKAREGLNKARTLLAESKTATDPKIKSDKLTQAQNAINDAAAIILRLSGGKIETTTVVTGDGSAQPGDTNSSTTSNTTSTSGPNANGNPTSTAGR